MVQALKKLVLFSNSSPACHQDEFPSSNCGELNYSTSLDTLLNQPECFYILSSLSNLSVYKLNAWAFIYFKLTWLIFIFCFWWSSKPRKCTSCNITLCWIVPNMTFEINLPHVMRWRPQHVSYSYCQRTQQDNYKQLEFVEREVFSITAATFVLKLESSMWEPPK